MINTNGIVKDLFTLSLLGEALQQAYPDLSLSTDNHGYVYAYTDPETKTAAVGVFEKGKCSDPKGALLLLFNMTVKTANICDAMLLQNPLATATVISVLINTLNIFEAEFKMDTISQIFETIFALPPLLDHMYQRKESRLKRDIQEAVGLINWIVAKIKFWCWSWFYDQRSGKIAQLQATLSARRTFWYEKAMECVKDRLIINMDGFEELIGLQEQGPSAAEFNAMSAEEKQTFFSRDRAERTLNAPSDTNKWLTKYHPDKYNEATLKAAVETTIGSHAPADAIDTNVKQAETYRNRAIVLNQLWRNLIEAKDKAPAHQPLDAQRLQGAIPQLG